MSNAYENEKAFLNRKLVTKKIEWEIVPALSQLISPPLPENEIKEIISQFRDVLGKKAAVVFPKMVFSVNSKLRGGLRVVVAIGLLREFFGAEIDGGGGGGGRRLNPLQTNPRPGGGR